MEDHNSNFISCLKEIQRTYVSLPKTLRLRVEHWVEKLSLTGGNMTWRKDRDMYTKMLLNMVLAKKLEAPFDKSPADGPLPPFPSQYKCKLKEMIGPHETSFWRDVYSNISDANVSIRATRSPHRPQRPDSSALNQTLSRRENDNLMFLNQELDRRVLLLEQQLQEERLKHEIELQRLLNEQRHELMRLKETTRNLKSPTNPNSHVDSSLNQSTQFFRDILKSTQDENSAHNLSRISAEEFVRKSIDGAVGNGSFSSSESRKHRPANQPVNVSFSSSTKGGTFTRSNSSDLLPRQSSTEPKRSPGKFLDEQEQIHQELMTTADLSSQINATYSSSTGKKKDSYSVMDAVPTNDDDFLKYLEDFQEEIKSLRYKA